MFGSCEQHTIVLIVYICLKTRLIDGIFACKLGCYSNRSLIKLSFRRGRLAVYSGREYTKSLTCAAIQRRNPLIFFTKTERKKWKNTQKYCSVDVFPFLRRICMKNWSMFYHAWNRAEKQASVLKIDMKNWADIWGCACYLPKAKQGQTMTECFQISTKRQKRPVKRFSLFVRSLFCKFGAARQRI